MRYRSCIFHSCIFHPCDLLPHFPLLHFPLPHFQRPLEVSLEGISSQSLGKYWQLNQSNQHTSTYSRIQQQTNNPYYATIHNEYAKDNPRINRQDRQKITFPGFAYPKVISTVLSRYTHRSSALPVGPLGVFHPCLWPLKAPGSNFVWGSPNLLLARWRLYHHIHQK